MKDIIKYACGVCGAPLDENGDQLKEIPSKDYNPMDYPFTYCTYCGQIEYERQQERDRIRQIEEDEYYSDNF